MLCYIGGSRDVGIGDMSEEDIMDTCDRDIRKVLITSHHLTSPHITSHHLTSPHSTTRLSFKSNTNHEHKSSTPKQTTHPKPFLRHVCISASPLHFCISASPLHFCITSAFLHHLCISASLVHFCIHIHYTAHPLTTPILHL